jgi:hypothetical protein
VEQFAEDRRALKAVRALLNLISKPKLETMLFYIKKANVTTGNRKEVVRKSRYS